MAMAPALSRHPLRALCCAHRPSLRAAAKASARATTKPATLPPVLLPSRAATPASASGRVGKQQLHYTPAAAPLEDNDAADLAPLDSEGGASGSELGGLNNILPAGGLSLAGGRHRALVVDVSYRPINVVPWSRAVAMNLSGKVDVLELYAGEFAYSAYAAHPLPAVLRVRLYVDAQECASRVALNRRNIMLRDKFTCQYCGCKRQLTLDHVIPVSKGGRNRWDNLVSACAPCNQRKGNASLSQLGWRLSAQPAEPSPYEVGFILGISAGDVEAPPAEWEPYIAPFRERLERLRAARSEAALLAEQ